MDTDTIIDAVVKYTGVERERILGKCRKRRIVFARHLCMYFINKITRETYKYTGKILNPKKGLNHTSVMYGIMAINDMISIKDENTIIAIESIERDLNISLEESSIKERINSIAIMLNGLPLYPIEPCQTFGELAEQLNKRLSA